METRHEVSGTWPQAALKDKKRTYTMISAGLLVLCHCQFGQSQRPIVSMPHFIEIIRFLNQVPLEDLFSDQTKTQVRLYLSMIEENRLPFLQLENMMAVGTTLIITRQDKQSTSNLQGNAASDTPLFDSGKKEKVSLATIKVLLK